MRPSPVLHPRSTRPDARRLRPAVRPSGVVLPALLGAVLLLTHGAVAGAQTTLTSVVPRPAPLATPAVAPSAPGASTVRVVDLASDGQERGWLLADVLQGTDGYAVTVSRSALRVASPNARVLAVRAVLVDADTTHGWRVRAASAPVSAARLTGCVDGRLTAPVRFELPTSMTPDARGTRLAFEMVGQVRAPGDRKWSRSGERWLAGPVLAPSTTP